jgi:hypothetical protein
MMSKIPFPIPQPLIDTCEHLKEKNLQTFISPPFAPDDLSCVLDYLKQYDNNKSTFESYRREIERLIQWTWLIEKKSLLDLKRQDIENYVHLPQPTTIMDWR